MSGSRHPCFDWPERPQLQGASRAPVSAAPAQDAAGTTVRPGGEGLAPLLTLAAICLVPLGLVLAAQALIEALMRMPIVGVLIGAGLVFGGLIGMALTSDRPWRIEDDEEAVCLPSGLMGVRYQ